MKHQIIMSLQHLSLAHRRQSLIVRSTPVGRVASFVLDCGTSAMADEFELVMSRADIADYLALRIETVARAFSKLHSRRIIDLDGPRHRHVRILDPERLAVIGV